MDKILKYMYAIHYDQSAMFSSRDHRCNGSDFCSGDVRDK